MSDNTIQLTLPRVTRCGASRSWDLTSVLDGVLADFALRLSVR